MRNKFKLLFFLFSLFAITFDCVKREHSNPLDPDYTIQGPGLIEVKADTTFIRQWEYGIRSVIDTLTTGDGYLKEVKYPIVYINMWFNKSMVEHVNEFCMGNSFDAYDKITMRDCSTLRNDTDLNCRTSYSLHTKDENPKFVYMIFKFNSREVFRAKFYITNKTKIESGYLYGPSLWVDCQGVDMVGPNFLN